MSSKISIKTVKASKQLGFISVVLISSSLLVSILCHLLIGAGVGEVRTTRVDVCQTRPHHRWYNRRYQTDVSIQRLVDVCRTRPHHGWYNRRYQTDVSLQR